MTKEQFDYFKQHGFTDELVTIVFDEGWDKVDIENYILLYNHQNNEDVLLPTFARQKDVYGKSGKGKDSGKKPTKCDEEGKDCEGGKSKGTDGKGRKKGVKSTYTKNDKGDERSRSGKDGNQKSTKTKNAKHGEPSGSRKDGKGEKSNKTKNDEGEPSGSGKDGKGEKSKKTKNDKGEKSGSGKGKKKDKSNETKNVKHGETSWSDEPGRKNTKDRDEGNKRSKSKKSQMEINDPIVHFGTNVSEASDLYREGRGSENSDGHGGKSDESVVDEERGEVEECTDRKGDNLERGGKGSVGDEGSVDGVEGSEGSVADEGSVDGEVEDGNVDNRENVEYENTESEGNKDGEENEDADSAGNLEDGAKGGNVEGANVVEEESRYKCKFCTHGFDAYNAYIIHIESRHPGWQDSDTERNLQERIDLQLAAAIEGESEDSETVPVLDDKDMDERGLVE